MSQTRRTFLKTLSGAPVFGPRFQAMLARRKKQGGLAQSPKVAEARKSWWRAPKSITTAAVTLRAPAAPLPLVLGQFGITHIAVPNHQVTLIWDGGKGPFQLEGRASLTSPWFAIGNPTMQRTASFPATLPMEFFRIYQQPTMFWVKAGPKGAARLIWTNPTL